MAVISAETKDALLGRLEVIPPGGFLLARHPFNGGYNLMLSDIILAPRTDAVYNAHGYLTKVPVDAIIPFINEYTRPGEIVADMFAGSGMTAVAAKMAGRNAVVSDISILGQHIGHGYLSEVDTAKLRQTARAVIGAAREKTAHLYQTRRAGDGQPCEMIRTVWSYVYQCDQCKCDIVYYDALKANDWKAPVKCPYCGAAFAKKGKAVHAEKPVRVVVAGPYGKQMEQDITQGDLDQVAAAEIMPDLSETPRQRIDPDREMYQRSALQKWGYNYTHEFFSARNALSLTALWKGIQAIEEVGLRKKLLFTLTGILPRASKRYQWSPTVPLNASNQNYYIAPVYYEWNVYDLFERKLEAIIKADQLIARRAGSASNKGMKTVQRYEIASADHLAHLQAQSVDYVFTDPPFGSNIFYSDMNLFQEAWLGGAITDRTVEAVIHTTTRAKETGTSAEQYEKILTDACREAFRILKPGRHLTVVFGNSKGAIWSMVQRALSEAGFEARPVHIGILDKGQRSIKGLNSGTESVATLDLVVTVRKPHGVGQLLAPDGRASIGSIVEKVVRDFKLAALPTPSHVYLTILKEAMSNGLSLEDLHLADILAALRQNGYAVDQKTGRLQKGQLPTPNPHGWAGLVKFAGPVD